MTIKAYLKETYTFDFNATVSACMPEDNHFNIVLDKTYFYPEGGGQPCDMGKIDTLDVYDVQLVNDIVYHKTNAPLTVGKSVQCHIDKMRRVDFVQQHSGQHMLSAVANKHFNAQTVGFHLTQDKMTIDLDKALNEQEINQLEIEVNKQIRLNHPFVIHYPDEDKLKHLKMRKLPKVKKNIRIVEILNYDLVPCGGTHVNYSGEIGSVKIKSASAYKGGVRIALSCGNRAINEQINERAILKQLVHMTASPANQLLTGVSNLFKKIETLNEEYLNLETQCISHYIEKALNEIQIIKTYPVLTLHVQTPLSKKGFKHLYQSICKVFKGIIILANHTQLTLTNNHENKINIKNILTDIKEHYNISGGGSDTHCQLATGSQEESIEIIKHILNFIDTHQ